MLIRTPKSVIIGVAVKIAVKIGQNRKAVKNGVAHINLLNVNDFININYAFIHHYYSFNMDFARKNQGNLRQSEINNLFLRFFLLVRI